MNTTKYILSVIVMLLMFGKAWADDNTAIGLSVNNQNISIGSGTGWTFANNILTLSGNTDYTLSGSDDNGVVNVQVDANCNVTLSDLKLSRSYFSISTGRSVTVTLLGSNTLNGCTGYPGLEVPDGASLTINAADANSSLIAKGDSGCAGIGTKALATSWAGTITINGGRITATSVYGAGIGGGKGKDQFGEPYMYGAAGPVNINGGYITASSTYGAGIGGGYAAPRGAITITGGTIVAKSTYGDDIGFGADDSWITFPPVTIKGGSIVNFTFRSPSQSSNMSTIRDADSLQVYRVTIPNLGSNASVDLSGVFKDYGTKDIQADEKGNVYLYLNKYDGKFVANGTPYKLKVDTADATASSEGLLYIGESGWTTYYSGKPSDFTSTGLTAYTAINYINEEVFITKHQLVPANTGIVVKGAAGMYEVPEGNFKGYLPSLLKGALNMTKISENASGTNVNYYLNADLDQTTTAQPDFILATDESAELRANKAWLSIPASSVSQGKAAAKRLAFTIVDNGTTGIENIETRAAKGKHNAAYNLNGQKVAENTDNLKSGIYIVNGKKIIIR